MLITQPAHQKELKQLQASYQALPWYKRFWLRLWSWRLSSAIANINPENTTVENIKELLRLSSASWFFKSVFKLLDALKHTTLYIWISKPDITKPDLSHHKLLMSKNIIPDLIFPFLSNKDQGIIANLSKQTRDKFGYKALGATLRTNVAKGNQSTVEKMLRKYPNLLLERGYVTDYSGRTFKNITAFQYALWALDKHMWEALLASVPEDRNDLHKDLLQQYQQLETEGLTYTIKSQTIKKEYHFDFQPLIQALQTQINYYNNQHWQKIRAHWLTKVGGAQRLLPIHVINYYCCDETPFNLTSTFKEPTLKRNKYRYFRFFDDDTGLGVHFALYKFNKSLIRHNWRPIVDTQVTDTETIIAMTILCKVRTTEFIELKQRLEQSLVLQQQHVALDQLQYG